MADVSTVLVVGASGSVGRPVVEELTRHGASVRVLVRDGSQSGFPQGTDVRIGDIARPEAYVGVMDGVEAVVFTHGADGTAEEHEAVDYGAVKHVLDARSGPLRISLMTAIGVTDPTIWYNQGSEICDWKRRSERLVRASGLPYTIVRPAWFDHNAPDELEVVFLQGDRRSTGTPEDGVIGRRQIAEVLVGALLTDEAIAKTLELVARKGSALTDLAPSFSALDADDPASVDGVRDRDTQPRSEEPSRVLADLEVVRR